MSEHTPATDVEKPKRKILGRLRKAGALVAVSATLGGVAAPVARAEQDSAASASHEAVANLRQPGELPGIKVHLGREKLNTLRDSTVEIVYRNLNTPLGQAPDQWHPSCTGVKVSIPGQQGSYVMSSAHCFVELTGIRTGAFIDTVQPFNAAENFASSDIQYGIADPGDTDLNDRLATPSAVADNISISTAGKDTALLHVNAVPIPQEALPRVRSFAEIPAVPLNIAEERPVQGTPVALYGESQANNFEPIAGTGIYLGRVWISEGANRSIGSDQPVTYRQLDLVGIQPTDLQNDNCNYGTSGSMALLPNGTMLGNLSMRSNNGYGPQKVIYSPDSIIFDNYWRPIWEQELDIDLSAFPTICGYTVMDKDTPEGLLKGFNIPASILGGKGADPTGIKP